MTEEFWGTVLSTNLLGPFRCTKAAAAALDDHAFLAESKRINDAGMAQLIEGCQRLGLDYIPSAGNFVAVKVGEAGKVFQGLLKRGVIVRPVANYAMPEYLRISIGLPEQNARCLAALHEMLGQVNTR